MNDFQYGKGKIIMIENETKETEYFVKSVNEPVESIHQLF